MMAGLGVCDPHIHVFDGTAYLYATRDASPFSRGYRMEEWWIWSSTDLQRWRLRYRLSPAQTYMGRGFSDCWATDAARRGGRYFWYLSEGNRRTAVVSADSPVGPWRDTLGRPMIESDMVPVGAYDPSVYVESDGSSYVVFGVWQFYMARLADDMVSLAERPRRLEILRPKGPYGAGRTDDKPFLHSRKGVYYLSWGCYYGMSDNLYGPYDCKGSFVRESMVDPRLRPREIPVTLDRHGSFFRWRGSWYFAMNDMGRSGNPYYRDFSICRVRYGSGGEIMPVRVSPEVNLAE